ncbi:hypothetical protein SL053_001363 [Flavobacterium psychrophilum]|uniref:Uncharacterized protein n=4 Tax=Flavobacterium psychrophilum TaxID=96345 RepID=A6GXE1_FLAPJ|nr:hypothetical protein [Flavobacterium psychrophilum]AIG29559.1 hypothetical protein IA03_03300 [Flavobacterium psychrophilum]AIG31836.1 hypothetical protein IA01_03315 [Flavobacterium psychrophilum]AIG33990.1 hypothetical protein IA02_02705 [Flavobacterium psychrophilum]AIG36353.1 hypothetical protein IA04_03210 [Flavobacterium psychrophilum]AIG38619.1 hypothetical protein IA05_03300 [Flavobacterium psychrophilum]
MRYSILFILALVICITSCRKDFETVPSSGKLEFSKTTVYLDTVFANIGSSTYMLKVYNRSNNDITIPSIALGKGNASKYRLMVDGMRGTNGKIFPNVQLLAHDSLFVFIETTVDIAAANPADMLYTDEILFDAGALQQKVNLVTLIQDAVFLFPDRTINEQLQLDNNDPNSYTYGFELTGTKLHFTKAKPYVIYGYAGVDSGKKLIIDKGARIHFHDKSGIFVKRGGSIQVNGLPSPTATPLVNEVIFEGDRLEPSFAETPGQWGIIYLAEGSTNNVFNHVTIKNSTVGIFIDRQDATAVQISNTQIYNSSNYGIIARKGKINGDNIVINNAGKSSLACILGGTYNFVHCTFADYWQGTSRQSPTVYLDNAYTENGKIVSVSLQLQANFTNCIIYGPNNIEMGINKVDTPGLNFMTNITNCLIKFNDTNNQFSDNPLYTNLFAPSNNNLRSNSTTTFDPKFKNVAKNNLRIGLASAAKGRANSNAPYYITLDADGNSRTFPTSDIGAYEHASN